MALHNQTVDSRRESTHSATLLIVLKRVCTLRIDMVQTAEHQSALTYGQAGSPNQQGKVTASSRWEKKAKGYLGRRLMVLVIGNNQPSKHNSS